jgi:hypothetical protein
VSDELDSLFAVPPTKFVEERNRIVAALKGEGRKDEAKTVEKIPRPSVAVWTVNQIARRDPELVRRLGAITVRLQTAAGPEYGAAAAELRQVLDDLRGEAAAVLAAAGHEDVGPHLIQRVIANLRAAAGEAEPRSTLEQGRLVRDVEEQEMTSLFGMAAADAEGPPARAKAADAKPKAAAGTAADAKAQERARAKELATAEREVKRLRAEAGAARKNVERAESTITAARESLAVAEVRAASARAAVKAADEALAKAEADLARISGR